MFWFRLFECRKWNENAAHITRNSLFVDNEHFPRLFITQNEKLIQKYIQENVNILLKQPLLCTWKMEYEIQNVFIVKCFGQTNEIY